MLKIQDDVTNVANQKIKNNPFDRQSLYIMISRINNHEFEVQFNRPVNR